MKYGRGLSVQAPKQIPDEYTGDIKAVAGVAGGEGAGRSGREIVKEWAEGREAGRSGRKVELN